jgi:hypothetical protein
LFQRHLLFVGCRIVPSSVSTRNTGSSRRKRHDETSSIHAIMIRIHGYGTALERNLSTSAVPICKLLHLGKNTTCSHRESKREQHSSFQGKFSVVAFRAS